MKALKEILGVIECILVMIMFLPIVIPFVLWHTIRETYRITKKKIVKPNNRRNR